MYPRELQHMNQLLEDVQMNGIFADGKTFVDCIPRFPESDINKRYAEQKDKKGFDLREFVLHNFELPVSHSNGYSSNLNLSVQENIRLLWDVLTREPDVAAGSLIPLPHPYIVPGGRFGEIYYWDSYFTMLGLAVSGKAEMIGNMINNFSYLMNLEGYIPNGNRTYFLGRSQPPFFALMIELLAAIKGRSVITTHLPELEMEYDFWMKGAAMLSREEPFFGHTVLMPGGEVLNRYWDEHDTPRPEAFREDVELALQSAADKPTVYRNLRAGAESGWDFSCRWFRDKKSFATIDTCNIIPVDLNALMFHLEETIAEAWLLFGDADKASHYKAAAARRSAALQKYCWNEAAGFYFDYDIERIRQKEIYSLAAVYPLCFNIALMEQAKKVATVLTEKFLHAGGLTATLDITGQQWDAPNGWAPLQWMSVRGLGNYGHAELAATIARRWIKLNTDVFRRTGKLMEKYNVVDTHLEAGGGEYTGQDGFGWTNGVLLALIEKYGAG
jgi:alpha,alpha-trehalase